MLRDLIRPLLRDPLRSPFERRGGWSPASLFAAGEQGAWFDPADFSTQFQDSAGTTPVTASGQPVGLVLDKHSGLVLGTEQAGYSGKTLNGTLIDGVSTVSTAGVYRCTVRYVSGSGNLRITTSAGSSAVLTAPGSISISIPLTAGQQVFLDVTGAVNIVTDTVSVRSIAGNHLIQATAASRPVLTQDGSGYWYWAFDGVDDGLASAATVNLSAINQMAMTVGANKQSDALGMLVEFSADYNANAGSFALYPETSGTIKWSNGNGGTTRNLIGSTDSAAPQARVLTVTANIATPFMELRVNGSQTASSAATQGTGNYGNYTLYLGRRAGAAFAFNGRIYQLILRGATSTAAQVSSTERFAGSKMGIPL